MLLALMMFWFLLIGLSEGAVLENIEAYRVPIGWTTETEGYFFTPDSVYEITSEFLQLESDAGRWHDGFWNLYDQSREYKLTAKQRFDAIDAARESDNKYWENVLNEHVKRSQKELKEAKRPGVGVFAGAAYTGNGSVEAVVGAGIVWRLW